MRLGEASYPLLMRRYADISLVDATMDLIWLRLLDLLVMAGIAILFLLGFVNGSLAMLVAALFMLTGRFLLAMVADKNTWQTESDEPRTLFDQACGRLVSAGLRRERACGCYSLPQL